MKAPFTKPTAEMMRNGFISSYYSDDIEQWSKLKCKRYLLTYLPHILKWFIKDLIRKIKWFIFGHPFN